MSSETEFDLHSLKTALLAEISKGLMAQHEGFYKNGSEEFRTGMGTGLSWALVAISDAFIQNPELTGRDAGNAVNDLLGKVQEEEGEEDE